MVATRSGCCGTRTTPLSLLMSRVGPAIVLAFAPQALKASNAPIATSVLITTGKLPVWYGRNCRPTWTVRLRIIISPDQNKSNVLDVPASVKAGDARSLHRRGGDSVHDREHATWPGACDVEALQFAAQTCSRFKRAIRGRTLAPARSPGPPRQVPDLCQARSSVTRALFEGRDRRERSNGEVRAAVGDRFGIPAASRAALLIALRPWGLSQGRAPAGKSGRREQRRQVRWSRQRLIAAGRGPAVFGGVVRVGAGQSRWASHSASAAASHWQPSACSSSTSAGLRSPTIPHRQRPRRRQGRSTGTR